MLAKAKALKESQRRTALDILHKAEELYATMEESYASDGSQEERLEALEDSGEVDGESRRLLDNESKCSS